MDVGARGYGVQGRACPRMRMTLRKVALAGMGEIRKNFMCRFLASGCIRVTQFGARSLRQNKRYTANSWKITMRISEVIILQTSKNGKRTIEESGETHWKKNKQIVFWNNQLNVFWCLQGSALFQLEILQSFYSKWQFFKVLYIIWNVRGPSEVFINSYS